jgi:RNA recognition motif-containing protein
MSTKLQVGNLGEATGSTELERLFAPFGTVRSAVVIRVPDTGASAGYGFVEMESAPHASAAIAALDGQPNGDRPLSVTRSAGWGGPPAATKFAGSTTRGGPLPGGFGDRGGEGGGEASGNSRGGRVPRELAENDRKRHADRRVRGADHSVFPEES